MKNRNYLFNTLLILMGISLFLPMAVFGETDLEELKRRQEQVEIRVNNLHDEIDKKESEIDYVQSRISVLQQNISEIQEELTFHQKIVENLTINLEDREQAIVKVKQGLADSLRKLETVERNSSLASLLVHDSLSGAMKEIDQRRILTEKIGAQYGSIQEHVEALSTTRDQMELEKLALASSRVSLDLQHQALKSEEERSQYLLNSSKSMLTVAQNEQIDLKKQIFALAYDNHGKAITLDEAYQYTSLAVDKVNQISGKKISVPFVLALMRHESNFGNYLGKGNYKQAMCSQREINAFVQITQSLELDPDLMPVSQPAKNQSCGGAMGYAQFLPTTWLAYVDRISEITGNNPPSPWNPEDAFTAVVVKLVANGGADGQTPTAIRRSQWEAAMTYFSGYRWKDKNILPNIRWYADNILKTADSYRSLFGEE